LAKKSEMLKKDFEESKIEKAKLNASSINERKIATDPSMGELSPFYDNKSNFKKNDLNKFEKISKRLEDKPSLEIHEKITKNVDLKKAGVIYKMLAYVIDCSCVLLLVLSSISLIALSAQIPLDELTIFVSREFIIAFAPIFLLFYIFYFTLLERTSFSTLGKRIFSLKVVKVNKKNLSLITTFSRCFISLTSVLTLGLPVFLGWQDKLTDTMVVKYS
jgi:uncharacterized RDD family membrane protein YckC